jgi:acyl carrier protein
MEVTENMEENRQELMEILEETRPDIDFENETALIDKEMLDSFDIISIVSEINEAFDISINVNDLLPENFNSVDAILALIAKLQEE